MKMDSAIQRKGFKLTPLLFRKIHKWVGLILGLQFVLWTISGAVMALLDMDKVGGHSAAPSAATANPWPTNLARPPVDAPVESVSLRRIADRPVYEVKDGTGLRLFEASTSKPITIDGPLATEIARKAFHHEEPVKAVTRLEKANLEARDHAGAMWRIDFANNDNSSSYVSAETGRALVDRSDTWRTWDFVWMLHNMDYVNRTSFNHPLIIFVAFGALWLSFTGLYLLFKSFRRREFRWILGREKH